MIRFISIFAWRKSRQNRRCYATPESIQVHLTIAKGGKKMKSLVGVLFLLLGFSSECVSHDTYYIGNGWSEHRGDNDGFPHVHYPTEKGKARNVTQGHYQKRHLCDFIKG